MTSVDCTLPVVLNPKPRHLLLHIASPFVTKAWAWNRATKQFVLVDVAALNDTELCVVEHKGEFTSVEHINLGNLYVAKGVVTLPNTEFHSMDHIKLVY
jgi:hypothetical protein